MNFVWFSCFPSHNQNERKARDMASYDINAIILDNNVEGSLPNGLAKQVALAVLTRLVAPRPNLGANNALLDALRNAGTAGLHIDDIMKLLGFDARKQVQPRLYDLQNRGLVERLPAQKWRILEAAEVANPENQQEENALPANQGAPPMVARPRGPAPRGPAPRGPAPGGPTPRGPAPRGPTPRGPAPGGTGPRGPPPGGPTPQSQRPPVANTAQVTVALPGQASFISYKNTLQEYCQKQHLAVPQYKTEKYHVGFIGTVSFGSSYYKSEIPMPTGKDAEQRVGFDALKAINVLAEDATFDIHAAKNIKRKASTGGEGPPAKQLITDSSGTAFKSKLNEFSQKFHLPAPTYDTVATSSGFVATVSFQGREFKSSQPMSKKKLAEQNAAHVALYYFGQLNFLPPGANPESATPGSQPSKLGGEAGTGGLDVNSLILEARKESTPVDNKSKLNPAFSYKNKLQEYCQKNKLPIPTYETNGPPGAYVSKTTINGKQFNGSIEANKKAAEQAVAHLVLQDLGIMQKPGANGAAPNPLPENVPKPPAAMLQKAQSATAPKP